MSNISKAFRNGKAFIAFFVCGDPNLDATAAAVRAAVDGGADMVELNIPFSDPTAGDSVIQEANIRALEVGVTTDKIFQFVENLRDDVQVPILISGYANVVFSYGPDRFLEKCSSIGIDGLIVPDLPFEERDEFLPACEKYGVDLISMIAVTSKERTATIAKAAQGFLYIMACPGDREQELTDMMALVRKVSDIPCVVCLNGTEDSRFKAVASKTDGVVADTPFVELVARYGENAEKYVGGFVSYNKKALAALQ